MLTESGVYILQLQLGTWTYANQPAKPRSGKLKLAGLMHY
jgi:hypothetical protein